jgi:hypothetical protein
MDSDATRQLLEAIRSKPTLALDFLADLGGDPEEYGDPDKDWATASPAEVGEAFAAMVTDLVDGAPELMTGFAGLDLAAVDHEAIGHEVFRLIADPSAFGL